MQTVVLQSGVEVGIAIGIGLHAILIRRKLDEIFRFRYDALNRIFDAQH